MTLSNATTTICPAFKNVNPPTHSITVKIYKILDPNRNQSLKCHSEHLQDQSKVKSFLTKQSEATFHPYYSEFSFGLEAILLQCTTPHEATTTLHSKHIYLKLFGLEAGQEREGEFLHFMSMSWGGSHLSK